MYILDSTLREGEQTPGIIFSPFEKIAILSNIISFPISCIEIGMYNTSKTNNLFMKNVIEIKNKSNKEKWPLLGVSVRCLMEEVHSLINDFIPDVLFLIVPVDPELKMHIELNDLKKIFLFLRERGMLIRTHIVLMSFSDHYILYSNLSKYVWENIEEIDGVWISDTKGSILPNKMGDILYNITKTIGEEGLKRKVGVHFHNDRGVAIANTWTAISCGVERLSSCFGGLGDRSGITPTEILLYNLYNVRLDKIEDILFMLEKFTKINIVENHPLVGYRSKWHDSGIHIDILLKGGVFRDEIQEGIIIGPKSGKSAWSWFVNNNEIDVNSDVFYNIINILKMDTSTKIKEYRETWWDKEYLINIFKKLVR